MCLILRQAQDDGLLKGYFTEDGEELLIARLKPEKYSHPITKRLPSALALS
jgi:hypothetical protein